MSTIPRTDTPATVGPIRHLRPRSDGATQPVTTVELFFDLVYVFAVTQLSHLIVSEESVTGIAHAGFLLLVVWWAWIYTTWMANWFDPASREVRGVLAAVMFASLVMAAALPDALGAHGLLIAGVIVALAPVGAQVSAYLLSLIVAALLAGLALLPGDGVGIGVDDRQEHACCDDLPA